MKETKEIRMEKGKPYPLGWTENADGSVNLAAVLERSKECGVLLYPRRGGAPRRLAFREEDRIGKICCMKLIGLDAQEYEYNFYCGEEVITDPKARRICGNEKWGKKISPSLRGDSIEDAFDWKNDRRPQIPYENSIFYQLHVRGFTKHTSSGVTAKGTFAGLAEKIPYLKSLQVTAVELMPVYEFTELEAVKPLRQNAYPAKDQEGNPVEETLPRINYWGFKKGYYFAPKASYSVKDPVLEFKEMVRAFHAEGMEVILQFYFPKEINREMILEVIRYWVCEYHIDGVHLMGEQIPVGILASDPMLTDTKLIYYGFPYEEIYPVGQVPDVRNLAECRDEFQYDMRRFLKGDEDTLHQALRRMRCNPVQNGVINYITSYEGFSLADLVSYDRKHNEANGEDNKDGNPYNASWNCGVEGPTRKRTILQLRKRQMKNALALLLFSQGTPMLTAGDEFGQSREGNNNPYCQDNEISWLNWKLTEKNKDFLDYTKELIALRKAHPVLHQSRELTLMDYAACGYPDLSYHGKDAWRLMADRLNREAGLMYCGRYAPKDRAQEDDFFYIAMNMHWEPQRLALPDLPAGMRWEKVLDTQGDVVETQTDPLTKSITVPGRCIQVLESTGNPVRKGKKRKEK